MVERSRYSYYVLLATVLGTLAARLAVALSVDLFQDEALYAYVAVHDPFSFCPHPPGTGLMVRLGIAIVGRWELGVRLSSIILSSLTLLVIFLAARQLVGLRGAAGAALLAAAAPMYLIFGAICTPDSLQLFFWSLLILFTARALGLRAPEPGAPEDAGTAHATLKWWLVAGVCLGVGLYFKYMLILYVPSLLLCLVLHPGLRSRLREPGPWLALAVGFLLFVPAAVYWDYSHGWKTLRYHLVERQSYHFSPRFLGMYLAGHSAFYSPLIYLWCVVAMFHAGWRGVRRKDARLVFLFSMSVVVWTFFVVVASVTRRGLSREQWDAMAYLPAMIAAVAIYRDKLREWGETGKAAALRAAAIVSVCLGIAMSAAIVFEGVTGLLSSVLRTGTPFTALYGWKQMAAEADRQLASLPDPKNAFVVGDSFVPALQYVFYGTSGARVYAMDHPRNARYGVDAQLAEWGMTQSSLEAETGRDALFVDDERGDRRGRDSRKAEEHIEELHKMFRQVSEVEPVEARHGARIVRHFRLFRCLGLRSRAEWEPRVRNTR